MLHGQSGYVERSLCLIVSQLKPCESMSHFSQPSQSLVQVKCTYGSRCGDVETKLEVYIMHACIHTYTNYIHYITLHHITLHYIALHYLTFHYITFQYITYIHTYMHACMHAYMHTYIHTYIHTYMHACMQRHGNLGPHFVPPLKLEFEARIWRLNSARSS